MILLPHYIFSGGATLRRGSKQHFKVDATECVPPLRVE